jgi:hypothetical protein
MTRDITEQIKQAINVNALWSVSDFFYLLEKLHNLGFEANWEEGEHCTGFSLDGDVFGYIWKSYPLVFVREDHINGIRRIADDLDYIVFIASKDLVSPEFAISMDDDLTDRISFWFDKDSFSANDFWFHMIT